MFEPEPGRAFRLRAAEVTVPRSTVWWKGFVAVASVLARVAVLPGEGAGTWGQRAWRVRARCSRGRWQCGLRAGEPEPVSRCEPVAGNAVAQGRFRAVLVVPLTG
ncbi:hypothetical protein GCM10027445_21020 [Amycolatopsis endophytica]